MTVRPSTVPEPDLEVTPPRTAAAGVPAVAVSLGMAVRQMGVARSARNLLRLNQQTVRNWIDQGSLPALRVGRRVRVRRADF